jgi:hypothetical protein
VTTATRRSCSTTSNIKKIILATFDGELVSRWGSAVQFQLLYQNSSQKTCNFKSKIGFEEKSPNIPWTPSGKRISFWYAEWAPSRCSSQLQLETNSNLGWNIPF